MNKNNALSLSRRDLLVGSATLATAAWISTTLAASSSSGSRAMIQAQNTRAPISPMIYGGFIEHIGNLINHSLWSETLDDRKFYFGVLAKPEEKPTDRRGAMSYMQKWIAVGPISGISLHHESPFCCI